MRLSAIIPFAAALSGAAAFAGPVPETTPPQRVVSINLCTDQLAMMLAAPGQLLSITAMASDPRASVMAEDATAYPSNNGLAEEIYLLDPDLVLAGQFTARATVSMMRRLGIEVIEFAPARSLSDVSANMRKMGEALGREAQGRQMAEDFARRLSDINPTQIRPQDQPQNEPEPARPTAATYAVNGYSTGAESLSGEIIDAAGFHTLATELGLPYGGFLPLEALIMADPDLVISGSDYPGQARAEEVLSHPALTELTGGHMAMQDRDWICGLPSVLGAIERLSDERARLEVPQ
ncbi:ABC transporter substrate-binding protein [Celeribacter neptunius]|uniref:Iron complex transport system substrate-binding protein n=1 Tax=Celeribacter neptunius TaxID=588602 RepID=A0A1I3TI36_9RHOB|nr:ABC transporter substrate-binding protein [Celeribacter neptunius]SFJ70280.1 iron complex transport system substrate-binding protein [Celeribacter neptunius]